MATEKRLIDANELLSIYKKWIPQLALPEDEGDKRGVETCIAFLEDAPTVDAVEVVHGRWKSVKETEVYSPDHRCTFTHTAETCSVCDVRIGFIGSKFYLYDAYCPNCGARMDGGADYGG